MKERADRLDPRTLESRLRATAPAVTELMSHARRTLAAHTQGLSERLLELNQRYRAVLNQADALQQTDPRAQEGAVDAFEHAWADFQRCRRAVESGIGRLEARDRAPAAGSEPPAPNSA